MNWSDEKYVKLYVRQTATWRMWPWQARCVFPLLLQVAQGTGVVELGRRDPLTALSVLIMVPREVVAPAIEALLEDGTLEPVDGGYLIPKFIEAQEATKTPAAKKRDQRERDRAKARVTTDVPVTESHRVSPGVTECPPPAQPSPTTTTSPTTSPDKETTLSSGRSTSRVSPEDLLAKLTEDEFQVFEHWRVVMGHPDARATAKRKRRISDALKLYTVEQCQQAIDGCRASAWHMGANDRGRRYDSLELILRDAEHIERFIDEMRGAA